MVDTETTIGSGSKGVTTVIMRAGIRHRRGNANGAHGHQLVSIIQYASLEGTRYKTPLNRCVSNAVHDGLDT
jgi:hypothetical protein